VKLAVRYVPLLLLALAWEAAARLELSDALPAPSAVLVAWARLARDGELVANGLPSLYRAGTGLILAIALGSVLGVVMAWWRPLHALMSPLLELSYPVPKSALVPLTAFWLGFGNASKVLAIFLGGTLPVVLGAFNGARSSDRALVWSARSMGASRVRTLWDVVVPCALPELLAGIRIALALSFVLLLTTELYAAQSGLGYLISFLGDEGAYDAMFAAVLTVAFLGFVADRLFLRLTRRLLRWRE